MDVDHLNWRLPAPIITNFEPPRLVETSGKQENAYDETVRDFFVRHKHMDTHNNRMLAWCNDMNSEHSQATYEVDHGQWTSSDIKSELPQRRRDSLSRREWEARKESIRKLYLDDGETLQQVMKIMREQYNFDATEKMYKTRLSVWGFSTKNKRPDSRKARKKALRQASKSSDGATCEEFRSQLDSRYTSAEQYQSQPPVDLNSILQNTQTSSSSTFAPEELSKAFDYYFGQSHPSKSFFGYQ